jgi:hypothetical protein
VAAAKAADVGENIRWDLMAELAQELGPAAGPGGPPDASKATGVAAAPASSSVQQALLAVEARQRRMEEEEAVGASTGAGEHQLSASARPFVPQGAPVPPPAPPDMYTAEYEHGYYEAPGHDGGGAAYPPMGASWPKEGDGRWPNEIYADGYEGYGGSYPQIYQGDSSNTYAEGEHMGRPKAQRGLREDAPEFVPGGY